MADIFTTIFNCTVGVACWKGCLPGSYWWGSKESNHIQQHLTANQLDKLLQKGPKTCQKQVYQTLPHRQKSTNVRLMHWTALTLENNLPLLYVYCYRDMACIIKKFIFKCLHVRL